MLFVDLDRFKEINDNLGHEVGDQLLVEIAERLLVVTGGQHTVSRFGGDEFTILIDKLGSQAVAIELTQHLKDAIAVPFDLEGTHVVIGASIGIAIGPDDASVAAERMLHDADLAMYDAKGQGAGFKLFDQSVSDKAASYFRIEADLRGSLERDELTVHYQPVIDLATGELVGVEALARWDRPGHGLVVADDFIVPAERSNLIVPIGRFVLAQACAQLSQWQRIRQAQDGASEPIWLSVNLSAPELLQNDLLDTVAEALSAHALPPSSLMVEITERLFVNVGGASAPRLNALRDLGVRLSIDDFGIAYSSLGYVKHLAVDQLKIDRAFVLDLGSDPRSSAIVNAVIEMAQSLGIAVVAEGIETADQLQALQSLHCELGQGYLLGVPQSAEALTARIVAGGTWSAPVQQEAQPNLL